MKTQQINETQKVITAETGKVLTNGGDFAQYPVELTVNIEDDTWYEIDKPAENEQTTI
jgi:hypothetical protein